MIFVIDNYALLQQAMDTFCDFLAQSRVSEEKIFDSKLAVYELIGNVLKYSGGGASLQGELENGYVRLKILSDRPFFPPDTSVCADALAEHGRGLFLVDRVCEERICTPDGALLLRIKTED